MKHLILFVVIVIGFFTPAFAKEVHITLLQANDVYEMTAVNGGKYGGLARVQTLTNELKKKNKNTYTILAGDLISPSAIGTAKVNGERLNGKQMVAVLNAMEWDYITLGNHEFDNGYEALLERLNESKFKIVSSNVIDAVTGKPFENTQNIDILTVKGVRIGFAGITLQSLAKDFVKIEDPLSTAQAVVSELRQKHKADIVVLITHQSIEDDMQFANTLKGVDLIVGGMNMRTSMCGGAWNLPQ